MTHEVAERATPLHYMAVCTCGWVFQTTRRQNALARAAKIRAAIRQHLSDRVCGPPKRLESLDRPAGSRTE